MTPAIRWAAMRAILMFSLIVSDEVTKRCPQTTTFEEKGDPKRIRTEVPLSVAESIDVFYCLSLPDVSAGKKPTLH